MKLPQLSLRELFLLVALVAMGCGWWVDRSRPKAQVDQLSDSVRRLDNAANLKNWEPEWTPPPGTLRDGFQLDAF